MEFQEFNKIYRVSRPCVITEKLDGTNAQVCITEDGGFLTGSRNRWITPADDNYGFSKWAHEHKDELMNLGVGRHFGEWWGKGIQRNYGIDSRRWSLFNTSRWCVFGTQPKRIITNNPTEEKYQEVLPECVGLVPVIFEGIFSTVAIDAAIEELKVHGSFAAQGFMKPEGVVCFHVQGNFCLKKTIERDEEHKGNRR